MEAGADTVVVVSNNKLAMFKSYTNETLDNMDKYFEGMDIILTEGFKEDNKPKIEVFRSSVHKTPLCITDQSLLAFVTDDTVDVDVPVFGLDDIKELSDFIVKTFLPEK